MKRYHTTESSRPLFTMKRTVVLLGIAAVFAVLTGCETLRGAGRDLQAAGDRMHTIVNRVNFLW